MSTGLYKYTSKEASNLLIGQNGFDLIAEHDTNTSTPDTGSWIAIQALGKGGGDAAVEFLKLKVTGPLLVRVISISAPNFPSCTFINSFCLF